MLLFSRRNDSRRTPGRTPHLYFEQLEPRLVMDAMSMAAGFMNTLREMVRPEAPPDGTNGLPINEVKQSELDDGTVPYESFFVPAAKGAWYTSAVLSHALRQASPTFTAGFTTAELLIQIDAAVASLEAILTTHAFVDDDLGDPAATGGKAFYQVHNTPSGEAPRGTTFEQTVSMADNVQLIAGLEVASQYLQNLEMSEATSLAGGIDAALAEFDLSMFWVGNVAKPGDAENPRGGDDPTGVLITESRLAPVVAFARGDIDQALFDATMTKTMRFTRVPNPASTPMPVEHLAPRGTALEIWAISPYLPERTSLLRTATLDAYVDAVIERVNQPDLDLPAAGATPIADGTDGSDGFNGFKEFALSPGSNPSSVVPFRDVKVLIPPASAMMAGGGSQAALDNLDAAVAAVEAIGDFDATYGVPNYRDFGTGFVNSGDPVRSSLEIGQAAYGLLNELLGGNYLEGLLRQRPGWNAAFNQYRDYINTRQAEHQEETGNGQPAERSMAFSQATRRLEHEQVGQSLRYHIEPAVAGDYDLILHYSNDDLGVGDELTVLLNGTPVDMFVSADTGDWNAFTIHTTPLGFVSGPIDVEIRMDSSDGFGWELDQLALKLIDDATPPTVTSVAVRGTGWDDSVPSYEIPGGDGSQLAPLPWENIDQFKITFRENVIVHQDDLEIRGVNLANYAIAGFSYNSSTFTATWTLDQAVGSDRLVLELNGSGSSSPVMDLFGTVLDGEWENPIDRDDALSNSFPSGNGMAGGDFVFRVDVLPGDRDQSGVTNVLDLIDIRNRVISSPTINPEKYTLFHDVNVDLVINVLDLIVTRNAVISFLPPDEPTRPSTTSALAGVSIGEEVDLSQILLEAFVPDESIGFELIMKG